ncbi:hypothetical protein ACNSOL_12120 (plasmid) [Aliarcobacter lanthieri]|uniref:hypothetical protein n=1 Tax=Aliarcobacter lanthieri TaxID=1355374 RepID=UPI003AABDA1A
MSIKNIIKKDKKLFYLSVLVILLLGITVGLFLFIISFNKNTFENINDYSVIHERFIEINANCEDDTLFKTSPEIIFNCDDKQTKIILDNKLTCDYTLFKDKWFIKNSHKEICSKDLAIKEINRIISSINITFQNKENIKNSWKIYP